MQTSVSIEILSAKVRLLNPDLDLAMLLLRVRGSDDFAAKTRIRIWIKTLLLVQLENENDEAFKETYTLVDDEIPVPANGAMEYRFTIGPVIPNNGVLIHQSHEIEDTYDLQVDVWELVDEGGFSGEPVWRFADREDCETVRLAPFPAGTPMNGIRPEDYF